MELRVLHAAIDHRVNEIATGHGDWPCRRGCDACCRRLAEIPRMSEDEWHLLRSGIEQLPDDHRRDFATRIDELASSSRPFVCPLLNLNTGECTVYEHRPIACRTYGFYVERDRGLYCSEIQSRVDSGEMNDVVWGNAEAVSIGPERDLVQWFRLESQPASGAVPQ